MGLFEEILRDLPYPKKSAAYSIAEKEKIVKKALKAFEQVASLKDRPCEVCKYREDGMCVRWLCVFEGSDNDDT
jgi:heme oxygenase